MGPKGQARPTLDSLGPLGQARPTIHIMSTFGLEQARPMPSLPTMDTVYSSK